LYIFQTKAKAIKKILKISLISLSVIISIPVIALLLFQIPAVQTYVGQKAAEAITDITRTPVTVQGVRIRGFHSFSLKGLYIEDYKKDTLIYAEDVNLKIDSIDLDSSLIFINKIELDKMYFNLQESKNKVLNIEHFIDSLSKESSDTTSKAWDCKFKNISIKRSRFDYVVENHPKVNYEINWDNISVRDLNIDITDLSFKGDTAFFKSNALSLKEITGFQLDSLTGDAAIGAGFMYLDNLLIKTPYSRLNVDELKYNWKPGKDYWKHFVKKMQQKYVITNSYASFRDIAYFNGKLAGLKEVFYGSATGYNTISNFAVKDIDLHFGKNSVIKGEFSSLGLPDIFNAKYLADFEELTFSFEDLENIYIPWEEDEKYTFWDKFKKFGNISYLGSFKGSLGDFVCNGILNTDLGYVVANTKVQPTKDGEKINVDGFAQVIDFDLGLLLDNSSLGKIKLDTRLNGSFDKLVGFAGVLDGNISEFTCFGYKYRNLDLKGDIDKKKFVGKIKLKDENIGLDFTGGLDFNDKFPVANFSAEIKNAKLKKLLILDQDVNISTEIKADFSGNSIDNFNGSINIYNTLCSNEKESVRLDKFSLYTDVTAVTNVLTLKSDFASFSLKGEYELASLVDDFTGQIYKHLPNYKPNNYVFRDYSQNKFELDLDLYKSQNLLKIFYPSIRIKNGASVHWNHRFYNDDMEFIFKSPTIRYKSNLMSDVEMKLKNTGKELYCESSVGGYGYDGDYEIHNIKNKITASSNKIFSELSWNNWDSKTYGGYFAANAIVSKTDKQKAKTDITFDEGTLIVSDSLWTFKPSKLSIVEKNYEIKDFKIYKGDHYISLDGKVSTLPKDTLKLKFHKCDLDKIGELLNLPVKDLTGHINGFVNINDFYNKTRAISDIRVTDLVYDTDSVGNVYLSSKWDDIRKRLLLDVYLKREEERQISLVGWYKPSNNAVRLNASIDSLNLSFAKLYYDDVFKDISGSLSANIDLSNTLSNPVYRGGIYINDSDFTLKKTNTRYYCNDSIQISPQNIIFDNFIIKDEEGRLARIIGNIKIANKSMFDVAIEMNNFKLLNTKLYDNSNFYGTTYLTGRTQIFGPVGDLNIDIDVKTEKGTNINVPIGSTSSVSSSDFITFIKPSELKRQEEEREEDEYVYYKKNSNINLNCNLEITEDVNTQIIFNAKLGDAIKANGNGNLKIELNRSGQLDMYGTYNIIQGSYLFNLKNVLNKKFTIAKGGSIKWSGNPKSAAVDFSAIYKVRTTLYDLMPDNKDPNINLYQKVPVNCVMNFNGNILKPNSRFSIEFPSLNQQNRSYVESLFRSQDEINKQMLFLLVLNRFNTPENVTIEENNRGANVNDGWNTVSELASNQLSNWISQISDKVDFGFKYRPKDEISSDEIELALNTQLFSDRVTLNVNGNIDTGSNENAVRNNNSIVGDFDIEWKLTAKGDLRFKAYTHTNDQVTYKSSKTTQGISLQYQEEFNSFTELVCNYFNAIFGKKKNKKTGHQDAPSNE